MANSKYIKGQELMVFMGGKSVAGATNHTLSITAETEDISAKTKDEQHGAWIESEVKQFNWELTTENLITFVQYGVGNTLNDLYDAMTNGELVEVVFAHNKEEKVPEADGFSPVESMSNTDLHQFYISGSAYITSLQVNAQDGENATFSATFTGSGKLTRKEVE